MNWNQILDKEFSCSKGKTGIKQRSKLRTERLSAAVDICGGMGTGWPCYQDNVW